MNIRPRTPITFRNLHEHTEQEVFDYICLKLIEQSKPSTRVSGDCAYAGKGGTACAVGVLIDDRGVAEAIDDGHETDLPGFDKKACRDVLRIAGFRAGVAAYLGWRDDLPHLCLLEEMQCAHDASARANEFTQTFRERARLIAAERHLDPHILDAA